MAERETDARGGIQSGGQPEYQPPAVIWEESIDQGAMLAAACGKSDGFPDIACEAAPAS